MAQVRTSEKLSSRTGSLVKLGCSLMASGEGAKAVALLDHLLAENPGDARLREAARIVLSHQVPKFHAGMLADEGRNRAYEGALARASPGRKVLDIGAGSGLLAMMAVRGGAGSVLACEANEALAATARDIVAANGLEDRVRVIGKHSTRLDVEADLGGAADLVVTEIFSENLIGEGILPTLRDAVRRLAREGAPVIPARGSIRVGLADYHGRPLPSAGTVSGFDLSLFNRHAPPSPTLAVDHKALALRSAGQDLFEFDFAAADFLPETEATVRAVSHGGRITGILQWIRLQLDAEEAYENLPGPGARSHWAVHYHPLPAEIASSPGQEVLLHGWRDDHRVAMWADG